MIKNITLAVIFISSLVYSHCQVPCGIYDDALRIHQIQEHIETITKEKIRGKFNPINIANIKAGARLSRSDTRIK